MTPDQSIYCIDDKELYALSIRYEQLMREAREILFKLGYELNLVDGLNGTKDEEE